MSKEAMKLALEALEELNNTNSHWWQEVDKDTVDKIEPAITALRKALAEQPAQQEPVASVPIHPKTGPLWAMTTDKPDSERLPSYPLMSLYTSPPAQRTWVGLTDEEIESIAKEYQSRLATALMIEAKLKEKNT